MLLATPTHPTIVLVLIRKPFVPGPFCHHSTKSKAQDSSKASVSPTAGNVLARNPPQQTKRLVTSTSCATVLLSKIQHGDHTGWLENATLSREKAPQERRALCKVDPTQPLNFPSERDRRPQELQQPWVRKVSQCL